VWQLTICIATEAARHDAIANLKYFGIRDTSDPTSMVAVTSAMRRHLIWPAPAPFTFFHLAKFGWAPFADFHVQRMAIKLNAEFTEGG